MRLYNYIITAAVALGTVSCGNDWLDQEPSTSVQTEQSIPRIAEAEFSVNGVYNIMSSAYAYSGRLVFYGDVTGDDMQAVSATKRTANYYRFNFSQETAPSTHWQYLYAIIQNCNNILDKIENITVSDNEKSRYNNVKGEALCLRAMALFDLTRIFGYPYMKDNGASLGVPIRITELSVTDKPARNTVAECYEQIIKDFTEGCNFISENFTKGHMNKWSALTLLSRVYLYKGDNAAALAAAKQAIEGAEKKGYALWTNEEYPTAWGNDVSATRPGEVLMEIVNSTTDSPGKESMGYLSSKDGYDDMCVTVSFYHLLLQDKDDVRLKLLDFDKTYYAYVNKYQPQPDEVIYDANIPLVRLSETYLNAAEAAQKLGDNDQAVKYLDPIVRRANPAKTVQGETLTLDRILTERRKELVGEGHRMYDAIRNGLKITRVNETDPKLRKTVHNTVYMEYDWTFDHIILPIPKDELDANPNMEPNTGY